MKSHKFRPSDFKWQFRTRLTTLVKEFYSIQINKLSKTIAQTNSNFFARKRYEELYEFDNKQVKGKLKLFVEFLREKGYTNPKVDKAVLKK